MNNTAVMEQLGAAERLTDDDCVEINTGVFILDTVSAILNTIY